MSAALCFVVALLCICSVVVARYCNCAPTCFSHVCKYMVMRDFISVKHKA